MSIQHSTFNVQYSKTLYALALLFCFFLMPDGYAQTSAKVTATVDTTAIKIGEQIHYSITVETDSTTLVYFPEGQTFSPLETVEALQIDTIPKANRRVLQRKYTLTQFDSGAYTIPPQRIAIDGQAFFTDTFQIKVANVAVDTTQQKLYDIKPLLEVEKPASRLWRLLLWGLLGLMVLGGLVYALFFWKKKPTEAEKEALLPPYDRALLELKKLENSKYLIQDEYKKYYSELTAIVRAYLEEEVHVAALESTTAQLIAALEMRKDAGKLTLDDQTLIQFRNLLQTADLVKFAKSKPAIAAAEQDRKTVEQLVTKTREALPEPTQEELLQDEAHVVARTQKQKRQNIYWAIGIAAGILLLGGLGAVTYFGVKHVRDTLFGHPTKALLEGEWVSSAYGFPPIALETPKVLLRQEVPLPPEIRKLVKETQAFAYGSYVGNFAVVTSSATYKEPVAPNFNAAIETALAGFEALGVKNLTTKQEEFVTRAGVQGLKTYGTGKGKDPTNQKPQTMRYTILSFGGRGFMQQVVITWEADDPYAEQIVTRIINSLDVKTQV